MCKEEGLIPLPRQVLPRVRAELARTRAYRFPDQTMEKAHAGVWVTSPLPGRITPYVSVRPSFLRLTLCYLIITLQ